MSFRQEKNPHFLAQPSFYSADIWVMKRYTVFIFTLLLIFSLSNCETMNSSVLTGRPEQPAGEQNSGAAQQGDSLQANSETGEGTLDPDLQAIAEEEAQAKAQVDPYADVERGYASWIGKELQGKPTASGSLFDMYEYTAAHRTYPMGSLILVRNLENGKKRLVRINDRGPYVDGRVIDVSYAVAKSLDFVDAGTAQVEVEMIEPGRDDFAAKAGEPSMKDPFLDNAVERSEISDDVMVLDEGRYEFSDGASPRGYTVRTGAFKVRSNAERYREELEERYRKSVYIGSRGKWNFVWIGDFSSEKEAQKFYETLKTDGLDVLSPGKVR